MNGHQFKNKQKNKFTFFSYPTTTTNPNKYRKFQKKN